MPQQTPKLSLPLLQPSQAQKHVTANEAFLQLDRLAQATVTSATETDPPVTPIEGDAYIPAIGATGEWAGQDEVLAVFDGTAWTFIVPQEGWTVYVRDQDRQWRYLDGGWDVVPNANSMNSLGINGTADAQNRLLVQSEAVLFNHDGADHHTTINKATTSDDASIGFQTGFSARGLIGLLGNDDVSIKVSSDGTNWTEALRLNGATGLPSGEAIQSAASDVTPGRLMRADYGYCPGNLIGQTSESGGVPTGAVMESGDNSDGQYMRFADGTQICTAELTVADIATAFGALFRSPTVEWTFPISFTGGLGSVGGLVDATGSWVARGSSSFSNNLVRLQVLRPTLAPSSVDIRVFAIGRWY